MNYILLPVYNEGERISETLEKLHRELVSYPHKFVMVDDGSRDGTPAKLRSLKKRYNLEILTHDKNLGPGAAFRTGLSWILKRAKDNDTVVTLESDNSGREELATKMIRTLSDGDLDAVLAGCFAPGGKMKHVPAFRQLLSRVTNVILKSIFPIPGVNTYTGFYRAYSASVLKAVYKKYNGKVISDDGFFSVVELLLKLAKIGGVKIAEIPMTLDWEGRRVSRMKVLSTIKSHLVFIAKLKLGGFKS